MRSPYFCAHIVCIEMSNSHLKTHVTLNRKEVKGIMWSWRFLIIDIGLTILLSEVAGQVATCAGDDGVRSPDQPPPVTVRPWHGNWRTIRCSYDTAMMAWVSGNTRNIRALFTTFLKLSRLKWEIDRSDFNQNTIGKVSLICLHEKCNICQLADAKTEISTQLIKSRIMCLGLADSDSQISPSVVILLEHYINWYNDARKNARHYQP